MAGFPSVAFGDTSPNVASLLGEETTRAGRFGWMTHDEVQKWLDGYIEAWASNDGATIGDLFTEDAVYSYRPWENDEVTVRGRDTIVSHWLRQPDDPATWEASYQPYAVEGDRAVAVGWSRYRATGNESERTYHNAYLLEFGDDGRCSSFHEFWMLKRD